MPISPRALDTLQRAVDEVGHTIIVTCAEGCKHYLYPRPVVPQSGMSDRRIKNADDEHWERDVFDPPASSRAATADIAEGFASPRGPADVDGDDFPGYSEFGG